MAIRESKENVRRQRKRPVRDVMRTEYQPGEGEEQTRQPTKKEQIISLFMSGVNEIEDLATLTGARPSYVASVLQQEGFMSGYFDLYTSTSNPMNAYSKFFAGRLGFKDLETARQSIDLIDRLHRQFDRIGDRAGQHHALMMALIMFNRARWTGKLQEADVFRSWLMERLDQAAFRPEDVEKPE